MVPLLKDRPVGCRSSDVLFGRRKPHAPAAPGIELDPWAGDPECPRLRAALEAGDVAPLRSAWGTADPVRREFLVHALTVDLPVLEVVERWPGASPSEPLAWLLRGSQRTTWAWEARGRAYATAVDPNAWHVFFDRLRDAEDDLQRSVALDDRDGVAWSQLLTTARGLQATPAEQRTRYDQAVARCPELPIAADLRLQAACAKWSGSHDEMFAFARQVVRSLGADDPRHRLLATAHFERAVDFREDVEARRVYLEDAAVRAELRDAAERSVLRWGAPATPQHRITVNWFAATAGYFGLHDLAAPLLVAVGPRPTRSPWSYFTGGARTWATHRQRAGLGPLAA
jgi:hypothetical protein